jgi:hypothetical protein
VRWANAAIDSGQVILQTAIASDEERALIMLSLACSWMKSLRSADVFTGGGISGFRPLQLIRPASIAFCSGLVDVESACFTAVMRAMGLRWEVTSTT